MSADPPADLPADPYEAGSDAASVRRITRIYWAMTALNTFAIGHVLSINTLFMIERGLSTVEWNLANAAYSAGMVLFEIPTGVVADTVGRRPSFLLSIVILFVGTVGTVLLADDLLSFALLNVLLGLGYTFASGALEAWVVDALRHHRFDGELSTVFARNGMVTAITMLLATTSGALLGSVDLEIPYVVRAAILVPLFVFVWRAMFDDGYQTQPLTLRTLVPQMNRTARRGFSAAFGSRAVALLMLAAIFPAAFFLFGWYSWQPYLIQDLGTVTFGSELVWLAGVISAVLMLATTVGNGLAPRIGRWARRPSRVLAGGTAITAVMILLGGAIPAFIDPGSDSNFAVALSCLLMTMLMFGVTGPTRQGLINDLIDGKERATVLSVDSLVSNLGTTVGVVALGWLAQDVTDRGGLGLGVGWVVGSVMILAAVPLLLLAGRAAGASDRFGRREASDRSHDDPGG